MSHPMFSDCRSTKYAHTRVLKNLISLISQSKLPDVALNAAKNTLQNVHRLHEKRRIAIVEFEELRDCELELLEYRRVYKMIVKEEEAKTAATNRFGIITCGLSFTAVALLQFNAYYYSLESPVLRKSEHLLYLYLTVYLLTILCMIATCPFDSHLPHEDTPKVSKIEIKNLKSEEIAKMMLVEEIRILDLYTKEVLPLKTQMYTIQNRRIYLKLGKSSPIYLFLLKTSYFILCNYYKSGAQSDLEYGIFTLLATFFSFAFVLNPFY